MSVFPMTRPRLQVTLNTEEDRTLLELRTSSSIPQRTKNSAEVLRPSHRGWTTEAIAEHFDWQVEMVRKTIYHWRQWGLGGLWDARRAGRPPKWTEADIASLEQLLQQEDQTHNSHQLVRHLYQEWQASLSRRQLRRILKKKCRWKSTCHSHRKLQALSKKSGKQADLELLLQAEHEGYIKLKYLDESGFDCWSSVNYIWSLKGTQTRQGQTPCRGGRVNIPDSSFPYGFAVSSITSAIYIRFIDGQAKQAQRLLKRSDKMTVMVQGHALIHTSRVVKQCIARWQEQGLYLFYLPRYSSELNLIEIKWHQIKAHEIRGRMFEDEYDLAMGVMEAMESRGKITRCKVNRFGYRSKRVLK